MRIIHTPGAPHSALFLSTLLHPFVLIPVTILIRTRDWRISGLVAAITVLPMLAVTAIRVRRGIWSNFDVSDRSQRSGLYRIGLPLTVVAGLVLAGIGAPPGVVRGTWIVAAMLLAGLVLGTFLKTSLHMMFGAYCAVLIVEGYPLSAPIVLACLPALGWSRQVLDRHALSEVIAGTVIGVIGGLVAVM